VRNIASTAKGFTIKIGQYHVRFWSTGFEYGNKFGGRVFSWYWFLKKWSKSNKGIGKNEL